MFAPDPKNMHQAQNFLDKRSMMSETRIIVNML